MAATKKAPKKPSGASKADQRLAAAALRKQQSGGKPTRDEAAALRRVQRARDAELRAEHYASVPKRDWSRWSGRQQKVINEQAERYGAPLGSATIALPEVARWLHEFLAAHARKLAGREQAEDREYWQALRERLKYENESQQRLARSDVHLGLARMAAVIRQAGESLQREFPGAEKILNDAMEDFEREVARLFGDDDSSDNGNG